VAIAAETTAAAGVAALAAAGTAMTITAQNAQAKAAQQSAMDSYNVNMQQKQLQQTQINQQTSREEIRLNMKSQAAEARLMTSAGESGVSGVSVDRNFNEIAGAGNQDIATLEANRTSQINQVQMGARGTAATTQGTINKNIGTTSLAAGLQIGSAAAQGYAVGKGDVK
jgi:hypothetical protein